MISALSGKEPH